MDELIRTAYIRGPLGPRGPQGPVGPKGEQGPIGLKGDKGDMGPMGPRGFQGPQGIQGTQGEKGDKGDQGIQGEKGDPFTYEDFTAAQLEALRGPQGEQGIQGPAGPKGDQGPQGVLGPKGADGIMTFEDLTEEQRESLRGPLGIQGPAGQDGSDGADGQDGHSPVVTASKSGSTTTIYVDGTSIATIEDGLDGQDGQNGTDGTNGQDGVTPHIDSTTGNWFIGTTDTGVHAQGPTGQDGNVANQLQADWNLTDNTQADYIKNKPTIPSAPDLTNYVQKSSTSGLLKNDGTVDTNVYIKTPTVNFNNHNYIDLGLPSGTLWATMNIGASSETDYGNYYKYGKGSTQYSNTDFYYTGTEEPLDLSVDTAHQVMGGDWCMPTKTQFEELIDQCTWTWIDNNGVEGFEVSKNGNSIFFPASGLYSNNVLDSVGVYGYYWSSTMKNTDYAYRLSFYKYNNPAANYYSDRVYGYSIRGVINVPRIVSTVAITGSYNDLTNKPTIPTIWRGTQAQYDLLTPDDNTIYIITSAS